MAEAAGREELHVTNSHQASTVTAGYAGRVLTLKIVFARLTTPVVL
jgi:hypothetical protein